MVVATKRLLWSKTAKKNLKDIAKYYKENASVQVAKNIVMAIQEEAQRLIFMSTIGAIEPELADEKQEYRYLISSHYKIIYYIKGKSIAIVCIFDCRQDPEKMKSSI